MTEGRVSSAAPLCMRGALGAPGEEKLSQSFGHVLLLLLPFPQGGILLASLKQHYTFDYCAAQKHHLHKDTEDASV